MIIALPLSLSGLHYLESLRFPANTTTPHPYYYFLYWNAHSRLFSVLYLISYAFVWTWSVTDCVYVFVMTPGVMPQGLIIIFLYIWPHGLLAFMYCQTFLNGSSNFMAVCDALVFHISLLSILWLGWQAGFTCLLGLVIICHIIENHNL